jgi:hypothetical protein
VFVGPKIFYYNETQTLVEAVSIGIKNENHVPERFSGDGGFVD